MPNLYGVIDSRDLLRTVPQITERNLATAISDYLALYNRILNELLGEYVTPLTDYQERYYVGASAGELDRSDEYSRGLQRRRPPLAYYDVAWPLAQWDDRLGWTQIYLAKATGDKIQRDLDSTQQRDRNTMLKEFLRSIFYSANYTFNDDEWGALTIRRLLNADGTVPPEYNNKTFLGTHTHYLGTSSATITAANFVTIFNHLWEHGLSGNIVVEAARNLETTIKGLSGFILASTFTDPNIIYGPQNVPNQARVGNPRAIGRINNMEVRIHDWFPDNYLFATDTSADPPIGMREDVQPELRGYQMTQDDPSDAYPLRNAFFRRRAGFGGRNRANGVAVFVNATANYTDPVI